ncbi:hypothetical protein BC833DRAFT_573919 [Globomyces pollinis-pini]|nr:hypothetical protein BC833DRAFT_573919 [Globomyces pollinis-pini]
MLCGFLPFDDDPTNVDGDDINRLYKYILETQLIYPKHVSESAKSLTASILVVDPKKRATLASIKNHIWLKPWWSIMNEGSKEVKELDDIVPESSVPRIETSLIADVKTIAKGEEAHVPKVIVNDDLRDMQPAADPELLSPPVSPVESVSVITYPNDPQGRSKSMDVGKAPTEIPVLDRASIQVDSWKHKSRRYLKSDLKFHAGPLDRKAISSQPPMAVMEKIIKVVTDMNLDIAFTSDPYCIKVYKRPQDGVDDEVSGESTLSEDKRKEVVKLPYNIIHALKGLRHFGMLYNRGYSGETEVIDSDTRIELTETVKFKIMVHAIKNLDGIVSVDFKRMRGDVWEFKRLYHSVIGSLSLGVDTEE